MGTPVDFKSKISLVNYLDSSMIQFLEAKTSTEVITKLVERLALSGKIHEKEAFCHAVLEREELASTGIGMGVAIPHAKLPCFNDFFIAIGLVKNGVNWGSMDKQDVNLVFLIGGPDDKQTEYLHLLSQLTYFLRDEEVRKKISQIKSSEELIEVFEYIKG